MRPARQRRHRHPGLPNDDDGTLFTANVPAAMGRPLPHDLAALIGREVRVDNDANCFALSEAWDDEFRRYRRCWASSSAPA